MDEQYAQDCATWVDDYGRDIYESLYGDGSAPAGKLTGPQTNGGPSTPPPPPPKKD